MEDFTIIINKIITYIKKPNCIREENQTSNHIFKTLLTILGLAFALNFFFIIIIGGLESFGLFSMDDHAINKMFEELSPIMIIAAAVVIAPIFEELIFRAPITLFCQYKKHFAWIFYTFAFAFGYMHIANYELNTTIWLLSPILVAPQIILGLLLGYIRVNFGLIYAMLFHAVYNAILIVPSVLFYTPEV